MTNLINNIVTEVDESREQMFNILENIKYSNGKKIKIKNKLSDQEKAEKY